MTRMLSAYDGASFDLFPVDYPTSSSPQAWAAGAILLLVTTMLGLTIDVPARVPRLRLSGLVVAGASMTIEVETVEGRALAAVHGGPAELRVDGATRGMSGARDG